MLWVSKLGSLVFLLVFLSVSSGYCQDVTLTMPLESVKKIVVDLEKVRLYEEQIIVLEKGSEELVKQNKLILEQNVLIKDQIQLKQDQLELATTEMENMKKMYEAKLQACEDGKPTFTQKLSLMAGSAGVGALIFGVILLFL